MKELRELNASTMAQTRLSLEPQNKKDFLWTCVLQTFALIIGTLFGVFAILAWLATRHANALASDSNSEAQGANCLATTANNLALLSYCASNTNASVASACAAYEDAALGQIEKTASSLALSVPTSGLSCSSANDSAGTAGPGGIGIIVGCILGGVMGVVLIYYLIRLVSQRYKERVNLVQKLESMISTASSAEPELVNHTRDVPNMPVSQEKANLIYERENSRDRV